MNCTAFTYYVTLMALIASSVKITTIKHIAVMYGFKSSGWFDVETCMHVLGLHVIYQYSWCYQASTTIMIHCKIVSSCTDYVTDYKYVTFYA